MVCRYDFALAHIGHIDCIEFPKSISVMARKVNDYSLNKQSLHSATILSYKFWNVYQHLSLR